MYKIVFDLTFAESSFRIDIKECVFAVLLGALALAIGWRSQRKSRRIVALSLGTVLMVFGLLMIRQAIWADKRFSRCLKLLRSGGISTLEGTVESVYHSDGQSHKWSNFVVARQEFNVVPLWKQCGCRMFPDNAVSIGDKVRVSLIQGAVVRIEVQDGLSR